MKNKIPKDLKYNELINLLPERGYIEATKDQVLSINNPMANCNIHLSNYTQNYVFWYNPDEQILIQINRPRIPFKILIVIYIPLWYIVCVCFGSRHIFEHYLNVSKPGYVTTDRAHLDEYEHEHLCKLLGLDEYII
ncbi:hypothetical protein WCWAEYFT_CDS0228 [Vibrio phage VB_VaC_TDDLMA]